jgi:hypothetical protein
MILKYFIVVLGLIVVAEGAYLVLRHPTNRFQTVSGYEGFMALDTRDGRLCSTMPGKQTPAIWKELGEKETNEELRADLSTLAMVPTCQSIR